LRTRREDMMIDEVEGEEEAESRGESFLSILREA
jgi:hypothetical protein